MKKLKLSIKFYLVLCISLIYVENNLLNAADKPYLAPKATVAPVIDGVVDTVWNNAAWAPIDQLWIGPAITTSDFSGMFKVLWTPEKLYVMAKITDDVLNTVYPGACNNIYNFDCTEVFLDEDHSGGNHQYTYNAFAYHMAANGDVCDLGTDQQNHLFRNDITVTMDTLSEHTYIWEAAIKVFDDTYVYGANNIPDTLTEGKLMGFSIAYNDNDGGSSRVNMIGSQYIAGTDKNVSWINASYFGDLQLVKDTNATWVGNVKPEKSFTIFPNPAHQELSIITSKYSADSYYIQILSVTGRLMMNLKFDNNPNQPTTLVNISALSAGVYFLKAGNSNRYEVQKLLVQ
jgi:hypothetical protein